jgi:integrase
MPRRSKNSRKSGLKVPSYRLHKPTNQAVVTLSGRDIYLGLWDSSESHAEYDRLIAEWLSNGRHLPQQDWDLSIAEIALRYLEYAEGYYVKNGQPTGWLTHIKLVLRKLRQRYGHTLAVDFGPLAFKSFRQQFIDAGQSRGYINKLMSIVQRMFKWAASEQLLPGCVYTDLKMVEGLRKGRCKAPDHAPVKPVTDEVVNATLPFLGDVVADMVRFQRFTGARPGEVCLVRPCDVDKSGEVWFYRPESHKTEHHDRSRVVAIGPNAQAVLAPYLLRAQSAYCFSPRESEVKRRLAAHDARQTPLSCGNRPGSNLKSRPKREPSESYSVDSYRRAIHRACKKLNQVRESEAAKNGANATLIPVWSPNQLRHSVGTQVRAEFGLEASQVVLGHAKADVTQVYAERDLKLATEVAMRIG